jgi:general secretion pathway protein I
MNADTPYLFPSAFICVHPRLILSCLFESTPAQRRRAAKNSRGFTLLEMIVATLIMAIAVVGLLNGISGATRNASRVRDYNRVVQLARLRMNDLLLDPSLPVNGTLGDRFNPAITGGLEAGWQARAFNFEMPPTPTPGQAVLDRIELQVWWMSGADRRTFTLEAFRERILKPDDISMGAQQ